MNLGSRRSRLLLGAALVAMVMVALLLIRRSLDGPVHQGRTLRQWVAIRGAEGFEPPRTVEQKLAAEAIRTIGTNSLPYLLKWIDWQPGSLRLQLQSQVSRLPEWVARNTPVQQFLSRPYKRRSDAMIAFGALGPIAASTVPELHAMACPTNGVAPNEAALIALAGIGSPAVPVIADLLTNSPYATGTSMFLPLHLLGTNALPIVPVLVSRLEDPDASIALWSANFLGAMELAPALTVPALASCLSDDRPLVRQGACTALRSFGAAAAAALPCLTNALDDADSQVRAGAAEAIRVIGSEGFE